MQTQQTIDSGREFNQVKEHDHNGTTPCWCGFGVGSAVASPFGELPKPRPPKSLYDAYERPEMFGKKVSPAIAEQRIAMLEAENKTLKERIAGFERQHAALAAGIDKAEVAFKELTSKTPQAMFTKTCGQTNPLGNTLHGCIMPVDHGGPCRTTEPLKAA